MSQEIINEQPDPNKMLEEVVKAINSYYQSHSPKDDFIPDVVYDELPYLLKESSLIFTDKYERDVYLTGALAVLGGCFHNLYAYNEVDKKEVSTNLVSIIVAPAASGKGALNYSAKIAQKIKETFAARSKRIGSKTTNKLFIPANISSAGLIQLLEKNKGAGIMVESEIDTIVNANRQEWGNYSEIIRKCFENESYSMYRKIDKEHLEIKKLKLSLAISGTANQFTSLMQSAENGLFSRGCYYVFDSSGEGLKFFGRMKSEEDLETRFAKFAGIANDYYEAMLTFKKVNIGFTEQQLTEIQEALHPVYERYDDNYELQANVKRAFIVVQKIAATLSFLFECESGSVQEKIECKDNALRTATLLTRTYLHHSYYAYELLPNKGYMNMTDSQQRLLVALTDEFTMDEALEKAKEIGLSQRTAYYCIAAFKKKGLAMLLPTGQYKKQ
ncbi:MAG: DUF3987 domain-containing protein [Terrimonas sp.]|nr:DUF3987 domain-containing protein [Terrimonas sp.]